MSSIHASLYLGPGCDEIELVSYNSVAIREHFAPQPKIRMFATLARSIRQWS
jgi:hypothetical protein